MTAALRNIVTCFLGYASIFGPCNDVPPTVQVFQAAQECTHYVPSATDVAAMDWQQRRVFMQTQKAAQERVAAAIRNRDLIGPCEAAWTIAPR